MMSEYEKIFNDIEESIRETLSGRDLLLDRSKTTITLIDTSGFIWGSVALDDQLRFVVIALEIQILNILCKAINATIDYI